MRILIARLFWTFDLELQPESAQWNQHKAYLLWEKPPMLVKLIPRAESSRKRNVDMKQELSDERDTLVR